MDKYERVAKLGEGGQGKVYKVRSKTTGRELVCKMILCVDQETVELATKEAEVMGLLKHPHIIHYEGTFLHQGKAGLFLCLIMEYCSQGDLHTRMREHKQQKKQFSERTAVTYLRQVLAALEFMHKSGFCHRDIKAANILFDDRGAVKVGDFGLSTLMSPMGQQTVVGTPFYFAPEIMLQRKYTTKVDIWNLGIVFLELCTLRQRPANVEVLHNEQAVLEDIHREVTRQGYSRAFASVITQALRRRPQDRTSATDLLQQVNQIWGPEGELLAHPRPQSPALPQQQQQQRYATPDARLRHATPTRRTATPTRTGWERDPTPVKAMTPRGRDGAAGAALPMPAAAAAPTAHRDATPTRRTPGADATGGVGGIPVGRPPTLADILQLQQHVAGGAVEAAAAPPQPLRAATPTRRTATPPRRMVVPPTQHVHAPPQSPRPAVAAAGTPASNPLVLPQQPQGAPHLTAAAGAAQQLTTPHAHTRSHSEAGRERRGRAAAYHVDPAPPTRDADKPQPGTVAGGSRITTPTTPSGRAGNAAASGGLFERGHGSGRHEPPPTDRQLPASLSAAVAHLMSGMTAERALAVAMREPKAAAVPTAHSSQGSGAGSSDSNGLTSVGSGGTTASSGQAASAPAPVRHTRRSPMPSGDGPRDNSASRTAVLSPRGPHGRPPMPVPTPQQYAHNAAQHPAAACTSPSPTPRVALQYGDTPSPSPAAKGRPQAPPPQAHEAPPDEAFQSVVQKLLSLNFSDVRTKARLLACHSRPEVMTLCGSVRDDDLLTSALEQWLSLKVSA